MEFVYSGPREGTKGIPRRYKRFSKGRTVIIQPSTKTRKTSTSSRSSSRRRILREHTKRIHPSSNIPKNRIRRTQIQVQEVIPKDTTKQSVSIQTKIQSKRPQKIEIRIKKKIQIQKVPFNENKMYMFVIVHFLPILSDSPVASKHGARMTLESSKVRIRFIDF